MGILSAFFEPPQTRKHRKAAQAAAQLREQAARDLFVELKVLHGFFQAAASRHQQAYSAGNFDLAGRYANALTGPNEMFERIERTGPEVEKEVQDRKRACSVAADWESYASFELELRDGFIKMREQAKQYAAALIKLNSEAHRAAQSGV